MSGYRGMWHNSSFLVQFEETWPRRLEQSSSKQGALWLNITKQEVYNVRLKSRLRMSYQTACRSKCLLKETISGLHAISDISTLRAHSWQISLGCCLV